MHVNDALESNTVVNTIFLKPGSYCYQYTVDDMAVYSSNRGAPGTTRRRLVSDRVNSTCLLPSSQPGSHCPQGRVAQTLNHGRIRACTGSSRRKLRSQVVHPIWNKLRRQFHKVDWKDSRPLENVGDKPCLGGVVEGRDGEAEFICELMPQVSHAWGANTRARLTRTISSRSTSS